MNFYPVLKVTKISTKYTTSKFATINDHKQTVKHVTLYAVDKANNRVILKMATQMNGKIGIIRKGSIIQLHNFTEIPFCYPGG